MISELRSEEEYVDAWGVRNPEGELVAFSSFTPDGLWTLMEGLGLASEGTAKEKLQAAGWRAVPVKIYPLRSEAKP